MVKESVEQFRPVFFLVLEFGKESIAGYVADDKYPKRQKQGIRKQLLILQNCSSFSHY